MKKLLLLLIIPLLSFGQDLDFTYISEPLVPFDYQGKYVNGAVWFDELGFNALIFSGTPIINSPVEFDHLHDYNFGVESIELSKFFAKHFLISNNEGEKNTALWEIKDYTEPTGYAGSYESGIYVEEFKLTDLNKNNIYETWILYRITMDGDFKIIMHEGEKKYAIRGDCEEYNMFGKNSFLNTPKSFQDYGNELVNDFCH